MKSVTKSELNRQTAKALAAVDAQRSVVMTERGMPRWRIDAIAAEEKSRPIEVTEEQTVLVQSRTAELQADSSIGLTWDELDARLGRRWK